MLMRKWMLLSVALPCSGFFFLPPAWSFKRFLPPSKSCQWFCHRSSPLVRRGLMFLLVLPLPHPLDSRPCSTPPKRPHPEDTLIARSPDRVNVKPSPSSTSSDPRTPGRRHPWTTPPMLETCRYLIPSLLICWQACARKLLSAWVELSAWVVDYLKRFVAYNVNGTHSQPLRTGHIACEGDAHYHLPDVGTLIISDLRNAIAELRDSHRLRTFLEMGSDRLAEGPQSAWKYLLPPPAPTVVSELAELFWHLEHADIVSVAPTMELARLALITSRDEEDDIEQTVTDLDAGPSGMGGAAELEMKDVETPGRQHDVSECMDNCVFQIETALLNFLGLDESEDGKSSVVKRDVALNF
ncbi:hypothetical protein BC827DRAFT_1156872 [Russula dissimulans]|nr:hypothetical protein BC827DRAFT_1156872 [Russula dissimulans]